MSKTRKWIVFFLIFAVISAGMTLEFSQRMSASVEIAAAEHDPDVVFSGGIAKYPGAGTYAWVLFIAGIVAFGAVALLVLRSGWRPEKLFLAMMVPLGLLYMFLMVPLAIPDEQVHYQSAYQISSVLLFRPGKGYAEHFTYTGLGGHWNLSSGYDRVARDLFAPAVGGEEIDLSFQYKLSYPVMYLPQALGVTLGRLLGGNFVRVFFMGRLFNLLFYTLCVYWAIRLMPKYKILMVMCGLVPMALHQAVSYSYDAFNICVAFLFFAAVFHTAAEKGKIRWKEFCAVGLIGLLLALAKPTNYPMLLLLLLIPAARFGGGKQKCLWLMGAWAVMLAAVLLVQWHGITQNLGVRSDSAVLNASNWEGKQGYDVTYILGHPLETLKVYLRTVRLYGTELFFQSLGRVLSGQTISMPSKYFRIYLILMVLCVLRKESGRTIPWTERGILLASLAGVVLMTMTTLFLAWTSVDKETIVGLQGRYFTPCLPLVMICLDNNTVLINRDTEKFVLIAGLVVHLGIIMEVLLRTMIT